MTQTSDTATQIVRGQLDAELAQIERAVKQRKKAMFRRGSKVKLVNLRPARPDLEGQIGTCVKVNATRITVELPDNRELLVPIEMLEPV